MSELKSLTLNGRTYDSFPDKSSVKTINGRTPDGNGDLDLSDSVYDLKEGYGYAEDIYIEEDGTETAMPGRNYKCFDFIPVKNGISYTMYGCGYALYDSQYDVLYAWYDSTGNNGMREFTPTENGFVRLTINCEDASYARFCRTDEMHLEPSDYAPKTSPFFDPKIPCNVHLYGDSTSAGYGLDDPSKSWANRLGALITSMQPIIYNRNFAAFADKKKPIWNETNLNENNPNVEYILRDTGYIRFTAYTNFFGVSATNVGEISVDIDGEPKDDIVPTSSDGKAEVAFRFDDYGTHTIELYGVSGINEIGSIATRKLRTFENHAVTGYSASNLPSIPDGNVAIVMYGTNDRMVRAGHFHRAINSFVRRCNAYGAVSYVFTPIPIPSYNEEMGGVKQSNNDIVAQLPVGCLNIYKDMEFVEMLSGRELYIHEGNAAGHYNELGQAFLYVVAASKLQLAPPMAELMPYFQNPGDGSIDLTGYATIEYVNSAIVEHGVRYVEVELKNVGADLIDESVKTVFDAVNAGIVVVLFRDTDDGARIFYRFEKTEHGSDGSETLTFAHRSLTLVQRIDLTMGGDMGGALGAIGVGTEILSAQSVGAVPIPVTAEIGQAMCVSEVDENGKPTQWEAADFPAGGSDNECDLLLDVTTTERVNLITQDIEPRAYKQIVLLVIATGHSDNSTAQYTAKITLRNAEGIEAVFDSAVPVHQKTTITYGKTLMNLSPKYAYGTGTSNTHSINQYGMTRYEVGAEFYSWNTNVIDRIQIDSSRNTMEIGAQIKVWGYRA